MVKRDAKEERNMYFKLLKKDIGKKLSMNIILLTFVVLATMFIASSFSNLVAVTAGQGEFFEKAELTDFIIVTMRGDYLEVNKSDEMIRDFLKREETVEEYNIDDILLVGKTNLKNSKGEESKVAQTMLLTSCDIKQQKFFDQNNKEIKNMERGTIYLPYDVLVKNDYEIGEEILLCSKSGYERKMKIAGTLKDAALGAQLMGTHRYVISDEDFKEALLESGIAAGNLYSINTSNIEDFKQAYNNEGFSVIFGGDTKLIKSTYLMDIVISAMLIVVSMCLIIISVVMLRFMISFSISEEYKEIGIMKAIGISNKNVRKLYMVKYIAISIVGGIIGFGLSIPFAKIMLDNASKTIVLEAKTSYLISILSSVLIVALIIMFAYIATKKINNMSPMDAIRSGNNGERFKKKGVFSLRKTKLKVSSFMAANDVFTEVKKYIAIFFAGLVGIWLLVTPINTVNTLGSDSSGELFSQLNCDVYLVDDNTLTELLVSGDRNEYYKYLDEIRSNLEANDILVKDIFMDNMFRYRVAKGEKSFNSFGLQGIYTKTTDYKYNEGTAPQFENEVGLGYKTAESIDAKIGDKILITIDGEEREFVVTALYQTMNNMGEGIRFHEDCKLDYKASSGTWGVQIILKDAGTKKELQSKIDKIKEIYPKADIKNTAEYMSDSLGGILEQMDSLKILLLVVVSIINVLVVVLMQKMFFIKEKGQIGMLKSIGFSNKAILIWQTKRVALVLFLGVLVGTLTGGLFCKITSGQVFKIMGLKSIDFVINPLEVYLIYPLAMMVVTLLACVITMRKIKTITVQDMNHNE